MFISHLSFLPRELIIYFYWTILVFFFTYSDNTHLLVIYTSNIHVQYEWKINIKINYFIIIVHYIHYVIVMWDIILVNKI